MAEMGDISKTTILLAEDDENDVMLIRRAFSKSHVINPIACVANGEEAVAYLSGEGAYADRDAHPLPFMLLGLLVCLIQAVVFCTLAMVYIGMATEHEEH